MFDKESAKEALKEALENVLGESVGKLNFDMRMFEDLHMDSTTMLESLLELEEKLGFDIDPEELDMEDFLTVNAYTEFLVQSVREKEND
ncbi:acyl carrier protein [Halomonas alkaliantarctica]|nr:acyl carrier protein [Halomonas alkaliantarctica]